MDKKNCILIVDDEPEIRESIANYLKGNGLETREAASAKEALTLIKASTPNLVILDIALGQDDGFSLCRDIQKTENIPIIFLSGKSEDTERIIGLELGADDFIAKPFNPRELLARVRAVLRRYLPKVPEPQGSRLTPLCFGPWTLDVSNQELIDKTDKTVALSTGEARLLKVFLDNPNQVLSRDMLLELTHGRQAVAFDRSIDSYISRIRKKVEENPEKPRYIKTYWGGGYALNCEYYCENNRLD